tara:strand:- start:33 stop:419 length:387 start_codon:yes stop_codon:yes gene_type:complete
MIVLRDNSEFNKCSECKEPLKNVRHLRNRPKLCASCRGDKTSENTLVRQMYREMIANPTEPSEDEMWFDDDPRAELEIEVGKVSRQVTEISYGVSELADIMTDGSNHYRYKHGSASQGTRYSYRKGKN